MQFYAPQTHAQLPTAVNFYHAITAAATRSQMELLSSYVLEWLF